MNEISNIPWGRVFSNFVWILGASVILASFSYHEFLAHVQRAKRTEVFKRDSLKKPLLLGVILVAAGISASVHKPWVAAIVGAAAILLAVWFFRIIRSQAG